MAHHETPLQARIMSLLHLASDGLLRFDDGKAVYTSVVLLLYAFSHDVMFTST